MFLAKMIAALVLFLAASASYADIHGSTIRTAYAVKPSSTTAATLTARDVDMFRIRVTSRGRLSLRTNGTTDTYGTLYDRNGRVIAQNNNGCKNRLNFCLSKILNAGTYYIKVTGSRRSTGRYNLVSSFTPTDDYGDTLTTAHPIYPNATVAGQLNSANDTDAFRIELPESGILSLRTDGATNTLGRLVDTDGAPVEEADNTCGNGTENFCISATLPAGVYYIKVRSPLGNIGTYRLVSEFVPTAIPVFLESLGTEYRSGELVYLDVSQIEVAGIALDIGGVPVETVIDEGTLVLKVPNVQPGRYSLRVAVGGEVYALPISILTAVLSTDPQAYVANVVAATQADISALRMDAPAEEVQFLDQLNALLTSLQGSIGELSQAQLAELVTALEANAVASSTDQLQSGGFSAHAEGQIVQSLLAPMAVADQCWATAEQYPVVFSSAVRSVSVATAAIVWLAFKPEPIAAAVAILAITKLAILTERARVQMSAIVENCLEPFGNLELRENDSGAVQTGSGGVQFRFRERAAELIGLSTPVRVVSWIDDGLRPYVEGLGNALLTLRTQLQDAGSILGITSAVPQYETPFLQYLLPREPVEVSASDYELVDISDDTVIGSAVDDNGTMRLTFTLTTAPLGNQPVSFQFGMRNRLTGESVGTYDVTLEPDDGCAVFQDLVLGAWTVTHTEYGTIYDLELFANGTGTYHVDGVDYPMSWRIARADEPLPSPWSNSYSPLRPLGVEPGCVLYDTGFWHYAYNGLVRSNLQTPLIGFAKYTLGGPFGWPESGSYFGYDLSTEEPTVVYTKVH